MKMLITIFATLVGLLLLAAGVIYSGRFEIAADQPHGSLTTRLIETARDRAIARGASNIDVPADLDGPERIANGAGEYAEMCTGCHLAPGMENTELRKGLYPLPPNLVEHAAHRSPAEQFWIIKHGLKLTGMPAWGLTHDDARIWSLVAFLRKLPQLTPEAYQELAGSGGGHHHDGEKGEEHGAGHEEGHAHRASANTMPEGAEAAATVVDRFQTSLAKGNTRAAADLLFPGVLVFEGGAAERSRDEYASHHLGADADFLKQAKVKRLARMGDALGDLAWVATESELTTGGARPMQVVTTETMVLRRETPGWRIAHIHWSSRKKE